MDFTEGVQDFSVVSDPLVNICDSITILLDIDMCSKQMFTISYIECF